MLMHRFILFNQDAGGGGSGGGGTGDDGPGDQGGQSQEDKSGTQGGSGSQDMVPRSEVEKARREAQNLRERTKKAEDELAEHRKAQMSDVEKAQKERDDAKAAQVAAEQRSRNLQAQVLARKVGIVDGEAAATLLKWDSIKDVDDDAEVEKALRQLLKDKPYLAGGTAAGADGGAGDGSGASSSTDMNALIRQRAGRA